ncbi:unnamed protein product, partial [Laminaria digitata]
ELASIASLSGSSNPAPEHRTAGGVAFTAGDPTELAARASSREQHKQRRLQIYGGGGSGVENYQPVALFGRGQQQHASPPLANPFATGGAATTATATATVTAAAAAAASAAARNT